jgi:hypothetical protein
MKRVIGFVPAAPRKDRSLITRPKTIGRPKTWKPLDPRRWPAWYVELQQKGKQ